LLALSATIKHLVKININRDRDRNTGMVSCTISMEEDILINLSFDPMAPVTGVIYAM